MKCISSVIYLLICAVISIRNCESSKILGIFSFPSPSHYLVVKPLLVRLAEKGHEVTVVGLYPPEQKIPNFEFVMLEANLHVVEHWMKMIPKGTLQMTRYAQYVVFMELMELTTRNMFEDEDFKKIMENPKDKFDLILYDMIIPTALVGLAEYFNASLVASSSFATEWRNDISVGNISPWSIVPHMVLPYDTKMNFMERLHNFCEHMMDWYIIEVYLNPTQKQLYKTYFPNAKLSYDEALSSHSLLLVNQHHSLTYPRPYVANVAEVGGLHIPHNPAPLPKDMQQFLDSATDGAIYFSMGSNIKGKELPIDKRNMILNVFRGLKQKILWKFEDDTLPNKPDNVFISPWCPQHSILKHPNVKVFITHGGLLSSTEAIFYGKPTLGMPMFSDQFKNVAVAVRRGYSLSIEFKNLTEENFKHALLELLYNPKYMNKMQELSRQYHDKPHTAMETAEFWVEYVLRHNGAKFLRNAIVDLHWLQYHSIDCIALLLIILILVILLIRKLLKMFFNFLLRFKNQKNTKPKSN